MLRGPSTGVSARRAPCRLKVACERPGRAAIASVPIQCPAPFMPASISTQYAALVAAGKIEHDTAQQAIVDKLAQLERRIVEHRLARKSSSLGWIFGARKRQEDPIKGL